VFSVSHQEKAVTSHRTKLFLFLDEPISFDVGIDFVFEHHSSVV